MTKQKPEELLKKKYAEMVELRDAINKAIEQRQVALATIMELQGWTPEEANTILGAQVFQVIEEKDGGHISDDNV